MIEEDYSENTLTDLQASAIIEAYRMAFPDMFDGKEGPFVKLETFSHEGKKHKGLFIFGNLIYFDPIRNRFMIRRMHDGVDENGKFYFEDDSSHTDLKNIIKRLVQRQLDFRMKLFLMNEIDEEGREIPFSSRYECAIRGRKHKEYNLEEN